MMAREPSANAALKAAAATALAVAASLWLGGVALAQAFRRSRSP